MGEANGFALGSLSQATSQENNKLFHPQRVPLKQSPLQPTPRAPKPTLSLGATPCPRSRRPRYARFISVLEQCWAHGTYSLNFTCHGHYFASDHEEVTLLVLSSFVEGFVNSCCCLILDLNLNDFWTYPWYIKWKEQIIKCNVKWGPRFYKIKLHSCPLHPDTYARTHPRAHSKVLVVIISDLCQLIFFPSRNSLFLSTECVKQQQ